LRFAEELMNSVRAKRCGRRIVTGFEWSIWTVSWFAALPKTWFEFRTVGLGIRIGTFRVGRILEIAFQSERKTARIEQMEFAGVLAIKLTLLK
jgi:hypothetical protein